MPVHEENWTYESFNPRPREEATRKLMRRT